MNNIMNNKSISPNEDQSPKGAANILLILYDL